MTRSVLNAHVDRVIKFYVAFPEARNLVEGQIYAQYADVELRRS